MFQIACEKNTLYSKEYCFWFELTNKTAQKGRKKGLCGAKSLLSIDGALETSRTSDPLLRRKMLYPSELRGQVLIYYHI